MGNDDNASRASTSTPQVPSQCPPPPLASPVVLHAIFRTSTMPLPSIGPIISFLRNSYSTWQPQAKVHDGIPTLFKVHDVRSKQLQAKSSSRIEMTNSAVFTNHNRPISVTTPHDAIVSEIIASDPETWVEAAEAAVRYLAKTDPVAADELAQQLVDAACAAAIAQEKKALVLRIKAEDSLDPSLMQTEFTEFKSERIAELMAAKRTSFRDLWNLVKSSYPEPHQMHFLELMETPQADFNGMLRKIDKAIETHTAQRGSKDASLQATLDEMRRYFNNHYDALCQVYPGYLSVPRNDLDDLWTRAGTDTFMKDAEARMVKKAMEIAPV